MYIICFDFLLMLTYLFLYSFFKLHFGRSPVMKRAPRKGHTSRLEVVETPWQQGYWVSSTVSLHRSLCTLFLELLKAQLFLLPEPFSLYLEGCTQTSDNISTQMLCSLHKTMQTTFVYLIDKFHYSDRYQTRVLKYPEHILTELHPQVINCFWIGPWASVKVLAFIFRFDFHSTALRLQSTLFHLSCMRQYKHSGADELWNYSLEDNWLLSCDIKIEEELGWEKKGPIMKGKRGRGCGWGKRMNCSKVREDGVTQLIGHFLNVHEARARLKVK